MTNEIKPKLQTIKEIINLTEKALREVEPSKLLMGDAEHAYKEDALRNCYNGLFMISRDAREREAPLMDVKALLEEVPEQEVLLDISEEIELLGADLHACAALLADQWEKLMVYQETVKAARTVLTIGDAPTTGNKWVKDEDYNAEDISNKVYGLFISLINDEDEKPGTPYRVHWMLYANSPLRANAYDIKRFIIEDSFDKTFTTEKTANAYIATVKAKFAPLFQDDDGKVPAHLLPHFSVGGVLLPGYRIEEEEA